MVAALLSVIRDRNAAGNVEPNLRNVPQQQRQKIWCFCADLFPWNQQLVEQDLKDPGQGGVEGLLNRFSNVVVVVGGGGRRVPADINPSVSVVSATLLPSLH